MQHGLATVSSLRLKQHEPSYDATLQGRHLNMHLDCQVEGLKALATGLLR